MSSDTGTNRGHNHVPPFETENFTGWKKQFTAFLMGIQSQMAMQPRPAYPMDNGDPPQPIIPGTVAGRKVVEDSMKAWDTADSKAYAALFTACRSHHQTKSLCENHNGTACLPLLSLLEERFHAAGTAFLNSAHVQMLQFAAIDSEDGLEMLLRFDNTNQRLIDGGIILEERQLQLIFLLAATKSRSRRFNRLSDAVETSVPPLTWEQIRELFRTFNRKNDLGSSSGGRNQHGRLDGNPNPQINYLRPTGGGRAIREFPAHSSRQIARHTGATSQRGQQRGEPPSCYICSAAHKVVDCPMLDQARALCRPNQQRQGGPARSNRHSNRPTPYQRSDPPSSGNASVRTTNAPSNSSRGGQTLRWHGQGRGGGGRGRGHQINMIVDDSDDSESDEVISNILPHNCLRLECCRSSSKSPVWKWNSSDCKREEDRYYQGTTKHMLETQSDPERNFSKLSASAQTVHEVECCKSHCLEITVSPDSLSKLSQLDNATYGSTINQPADWPLSEWITGTVPWVSARRNPDCGKSSAFSEGAEGGSLVSPHGLKPVSPDELSCPCCRMRVDDLNLPDMDMSVPRPSCPCPKHYGTKASQTPVYCERHRWRGIADKAARMYPPPIYLNEPPYRSHTGIWLTPTQSSEERFILRNQLMSQLSGGAWSVTHSMSSRSAQVLKHWWRSTWEPRAFDVSIPLTLSFQFPRYQVTSLETWRDSQDRLSLRIRRVARYTLPELALEEPYSQLDNMEQDRAREVLHVFNSTIQLFTLLPQYSGRVHLDQQGSRVWRPLHQDTLLQATASGRDTRTAYREHISAHNYRLTGLGIWKQRAVLNAQIRGDLWTDFRQRAINPVKEYTRVLMEEQMNPLERSLSLFRRLLDKDKEQMRMMHLISEHVYIADGFFPFRTMDALDVFEDPSLRPSVSLLGERDRVAVVHFLQEQAYTPHIYSPDVPFLFTSNHCTWLYRDLIEDVIHATRDGHRNEWKEVLQKVTRNYVHLLPRRLIEVSPHNLSRAFRCVPLDTPSHRPVEVPVFSSRIQEGYSPLVGPNGTQMNDYMWESIVEASTRPYAGLTINATVSPHPSSPTLPLQHKESGYESDDSEESDSCAMPELVDDVSSDEECDPPVIYLEDDNCCNMIHSDSEDDDDPSGSTAIQIADSATGDDPKGEPKDDTRLDPPSRRKRIRLWPDEDRRQEARIQSRRSSPQTILRILRHDIPTSPITPIEEEPQQEYIAMVNEDDHQEAHEAHARAGPNARASSVEHSPGSIADLFDHLCLAAQLDEEGADMNNILAIVDSGSSRTILTNTVKWLLTKSYSAEGLRVATAAQGGRLAITGAGIISDCYPEVLVSDQIRRSVVSLSDLVLADHSVTFAKDGGTIVRPDGEVINLIVSSANIWLVNLLHLFGPPTQCVGEVSALGNARPDKDDLDLLHSRAGHYSHALLREAVRNGLVTGVTLDRKHFGKKSSQKHRGVCDICAKVKITRGSFPQVETRMKDLRPGDVISADIVVAFSKPSRDGYKYVLLLVDHASKYVFVSPLSNREAVNVNHALNYFFSDVAPALGMVVKHFHSDGGAELVGKIVLGNLHARGVTTSHSPRDTPEMNSIAERKIKEVKQRCSCMLIHSCLPVAFWWDAFETAVHITNRLPTKTVIGLSTPFEVLRGTPPNIGRWRQWGCKVYTLKPIAERKKDWDEKALTGYLVGYAEQNTGYKIYVPAQDKIVVSVHVIVDEVTLSPSDDYLAEVTRLQVDVAPGEPQAVSLYEYLIGTTHVDDEDHLRYEITRLGVSKKGHIVGYRRLVTPAGSGTKEESVPIHIADLARLTKSLLPLSPAAVPPGGQRPTDKRARGQDTVGKTAPRIVSDNPTHSADKDISEKVDARGISQRRKKHRRTKAAPHAAFSSRKGVVESLTKTIDVPTQRPISKRTTHHRECKVKAVISALIAEAGVDSTPTSYAQALKSPESQRWKEAIAEELKSLYEDKGCWEYVRYPSHKVTPLRPHFVFKKKTHHGEVNRYKARMVVNGSQQVEGINYQETFSPVVKYDTMRMIFAISIIHSMPVHHLDVKTAFINADLEEEVYMYTHPEMKAPSGMMCRLRKSLYGLKQAPRNWNKLLNDFILSLGFKRCLQDTCLYIMMQSNYVVLLAVFVDDILVSCSSKGVMDDVKIQFTKRFEMTDFGLVTEFLGVRVMQTSTQTTLDQETYCRSILKKYSNHIGMRNYTDVPMAKDPGLEKDGELTEAQRKYVDKFPYSEIVGALLYLTSLTRVDISYAVGTLTRYMSKPTHSACKAVSRVLNYLNRFPNLGLKYKRMDMDMYAYTDSDWAACLKSRKSISGCLVILAGCCIAWLSKQQPIVAASSMEAEYISLFFLVQLLTWIRALMLEMELLVEGEAILIHIDNMAAKSLASNPVFHQRSKHIDVKYHWLREKVEEKAVRLEYISTEEQRADIMTKALTGQVFHRHMSQLMSEIQVTSTRASPVE